MIGKFIVKGLGLEVTENILFSNSQCILHWLKKEATVFVYWKQLTNEKDTAFHYIETAQNPTDVATWVIILVHNWYSPIDLESVQIKLTVVTVWRVIIRCANNELKV